MAWSVELWPGEITVEREGRQRRDLVDIDGLAESIARRGQLQPIVVTRDHVLVAGERRYTAVSKLGDRPLRCVYTDEIDPVELKALELEENVKRKDLTWQDECRAIYEYHTLKSNSNESWSEVDTAKELGISPSEAGYKIDIAIEMNKGNKLVLESPKLSTARGIVQRQNERKAAADEAALLAIANAKPIASKPTTATPRSEGAAEEVEEIDEDLATLALVESTRATGYILNEDFKDWAQYYDGPRFNLIHCDFPYGVGMHKSDQGSGDSYGTYEDTPEIYWSLLDTLNNHLDNFCETQAHLIFWFSMDYYTETLEILSKKWSVNPFPLVWVKTDNSGILPDANRGPRRTYETAFFASRGDRKIVRAVSNHIGSPIQRGRHMSEKPQVVLNHFFRMVIDEHSSVLDPTAGSGSAIRAAATSGAGRFLGLELDPEFAAAADEALMDHLDAMNKEQADG